MVLEKVRCYEKLERMLRKEVRVSDFLKLMAGDFSAMIAPSQRSRFSAYDSSREFSPARENSAFGGCMNLFGD